MPLSHAFCFVCSAERARVVAALDEEFSRLAPRALGRGVISGLFLIGKLSIKIQYKVQYKRAEMGGSRLENAHMTHMHNKP